MRAEMRAIIAPERKSERYPYRPSRIVDSVADLIAEMRKLAS